MSLAEDMINTFHIAPAKWADNLFFAGGLLIIDPVKFERFLKKRDLLRNDESINDCVRREFGEGSLALLDRAIKGERRNGGTTPRKQAGGQAS